MIGCLSRSVSSFLRDDGLVNMGSNGPFMPDIFMFTGVVTVSTSSVVDGVLFTNAVRIACSICDDCSV